MNPSGHIFARLSAGLIAAAIVISCAQAESPVSPGPDALVFVGDSANGMVSVITHRETANDVLTSIPVGSSSVGDITISSENHVFVNVTANNQVAAIDPLVEGNPELENFLPAGTSPGHAARDPSDGTLVWVMNDGDATSGDCAAAGPGGTAVSSVTVIQNHTVPGGGGSADTLGEVLAEVCVGRGHHKVTFSYPSTAHPGVARRAWVSNMTDGTISVIDANPASPNFATVISTIDLCDSAEESAPCDALLTTINEAQPHGIAYSSVSGMVYNSNVGYGTVSVIDAAAATLVDTLDIGFSGKAHVSPDGNFLAVAGADTASDPDHVIGKLSIVAVDDHTFQTHDLEDISPDDFEFTPDGAKLYVATATAFANAIQEARIENAVLLSFDTTALPTLGTPVEIPVGVSSEEHRALAIQEHDGVASHVWVPNPDEGTVTVVDAETDTVVETIEVGGEPTSIAVLVLE
jgi:YVTN family beta-propeller protein